MSTFDPGSLGVVAWLVIGTLLLMSTASVAVMLERGWTFRRLRRRSRVESEALFGLLRRGEMGDALALSAIVAPPTAVLVEALREWHRAATLGADAESALARADRLAQVSTTITLGDLRRGLAVLATIGSTAPFVGLFGTTVGIMNAFHAIGLTGAAGMGAISAGIAEALVTTALGLVVAVPAVWSYNALQARVAGFELELERSRYRLLASLAAAGGDGRS
jgi:biopolymer transport protein ExbB/biopolymer transport protein TolQ